MDPINHDQPPILVIGGTGMLGRPVVRRMVKDGLPVRVMARNPQRAKSQLPEAVEIVPGDLQDQASVEAAMDGVAYCHVNLENAMTRRKQPWDPDTEGSMVALRAAENVKLQRLSRTAALGIEEAADVWWAAQAKLDVEKAWLDSPVDCTIYHPTWFMESMSLFMMAGRLIVPKLNNVTLRWVAGDDYGRQVAAAFTMPCAANRVYAVQGPELVSPVDAAKRFAAAHPDHIKVQSVPMWPVRPLTLLSGQLHYMAKLMDMTRVHFSPLDQTEFETDLPKATMRIEDYVAYMLDTGDVPKK